MFSIKGGLVYTGKGVERDLHIQIEAEKFCSIGGEPAQLRAEYPVITPAFIDAHSHIA